MSPHPLVAPATDREPWPLADDQAGAGVRTPGGDLRALLPHAAALADMGSYELDLATGTARWSPGMHRILGLEPDGARRSVDVVLDWVHPEDRGRVGARIAAIADDPDAMPASEAPFELRMVRADGAVRELRAHGTVKRDADGRPRRWIGAVQDVSELRQRERELQARHAVTEVLGAWRSLEDSAVELLGRVGTALGYAMGALWLRDDDRDAVVASAFWSRSGVEAEPFASALCAETFRPGAGRLGRAWIGQAFEIATDVTIDPVFRPRAAAVRQGLRTALAFPAVDRDGDPVAILSFYSFDRREPTASGLQTLDAIGREVGSFLARRRAELGRRPVSARELEVLRLAADGHTGPAIARRLVVAPSTVKTHFNNIYAKLGVSDRAAAVAVALRSGLIE